MISGVFIQFFEFFCYILGIIWYTILCVIYFAALEKNIIFTPTDLYIYEMTGKD